MVLKGNYFEPNGQNDLVFDRFDWDFARCEAMDIYMFKLFDNFTKYDLCEQIWLFCQFLYHGGKTCLTA